MTDKNEFVGSSQFFSPAECSQFVNSLGGNGINDGPSVVHKMDKSLDQSVFEMVLRSFKNNNAMKLSVSSVHSILARNYTSKSSYLHTWPWTHEKLEQKLYMICMLNNESKDAVIKVSIGSSSRLVQPVVGVAYVWPAFATVTSERDINPGSIFLESIAIGKKLA